MQTTATASEDLVHRLVFNASAGATVLPIGSAKCEPTTKHMILPPSSGFLVTDLLRSQLHLPRGLQGVLEYGERSSVSFTAGTDSAAKRG
jgi:hypothetical protein